MKTNTYPHTLKPLLDVIFALILVMLLSWLMILIGLAYALTFQFPVFFSHSRLGQGGIEFKMWKFRTLSQKDSLPMQQRRFALGDLMRKSSMDELPQLWNVLKGKMSLVGPRPLPIEYLPLFSYEQKKRFTVKPGITGWAQVNGRHSISWKEKFELDNYYVDQVSFAMDMRILLKTIILVLSFKKDRSLEEPKFKGDN